MNGRILELRRQAEKAVLDCTTTLSPAEFNDIFVEIFAEMIVRECAQMVASSSLPDAYSEPCLEVIADEIKEHFGVEL